MNATGYEQALQHNDANWAFFHCMTQQDRDSFDKFLMSLNHPLVYQPMTQEARFKAYHKEGAR